MVGELADADRACRQLHGRRRGRTDQLAGGELGRLVGQSVVLVRTVRGPVKATGEAHRVADCTKLKGLTKASGGCSAPHGPGKQLRYLPTNRSRPEIADELSVPLNTVGTRLRRIYAKLGADDRSPALQRARELRLSPLLLCCYRPLIRIVPGGCRVHDAMVKGWQVKPRQQDPVTAGLALAAGRQQPQLPCALHGRRGPITDLGAWVPPLPVRRE
jgi:hypothetical protein